MYMYTKLYNKSFIIINIVLFFCLLENFYAKTMHKSLLKFKIKTPKVKNFDKKSEEVRNVYCGKTKELAFHEDLL